MKKATSNKKPVRLRTAPSPEVAKLIHDGVCQTLTAVQLLAKILIRKMEANKSPDLAAARELNELLQKARLELGAVTKQLGENPSQS